MFFCKAGVNIHPIRVVVGGLKKYKMFSTMPGISTCPINKSYYTVAFFENKLIIIYRWWSIRIGEALIRELKTKKKNFKSIRRSRVENKGNFLIGVEMNATDSPNSKWIGFLFSPSSLVRKHAQDSHLKIFLLRGFIF